MKSDLGAYWLGLRTRFEDSITDSKCSAANPQCHSDVTVKKRSLVVTTDGTQTEGNLLAGAMSQGFTDSEEVVIVHDCVRRWL